MDASDSASSSCELDRRAFLKTGAASLAGAATLGSTTPAVHVNAQPTEIIFAFGPDDSGTLQPLIDAFNREHEGDIRVRWREMARASDAYYRQLVSDFEADAADMDVFGADIVWTAPLVRRGWVQNLTRRFHGAYDPDEFVEPALQSAAYRFRIWGVPWYTDAGVLFYRRDLLERNGISSPPATWDALIDAARQITQADGVPHGFVFQGDEYEGGVANALEYIWNAGGRVMTLRGSVAATPGQNMIEPNVINVNSADAAAGLATARRMIDEGVAPQAVTRFREEEAWDEFLAGRAVFMRNWPYVYGLLDTEISQLSADQIGIALIPSSSNAHTRYSCLGGWNLMINDRSSNEKQDAAWTFIQYLTDPGPQKRRAIEGGFLPTRPQVYDDPEVQAQAPGIALSRAAVDRARVRPVSPYYMELSPRIARAFTRTLGGAFSGREAVSRLEDELHAILRRMR
jgi:multiple sugar transport system substrate-binding protein